MNIYKLDKHLSELGVLKGDKILVAVSGGMDSMCLLYSLVNSSLELQCSVAHVNFHLREDESNKDERLVRDWCRDKGVECFVKDVDTFAYSKLHSVSIEMAARDLRYNWFNELLDSGGYKFLAIAHNANDNAETLLLNLVRGTGVRGLCGISESIGKIIRPLLGCSRGEIEKFAFAFNVPYRDDHTNFESDYARNRVRNEVLPQLAKINPSVVSSLNRGIKYFSMASGILLGLAKIKREALVREGERGAICYLNVEALLQEEFWEYWLFEILQEYGFKSAQVEDIASGIYDSDVKRYVSDSYVVVKERGVLKVYPIYMLEQIEPLEIDLSAITTSGNIFNFGGAQIEICKVANSPEIMAQMKDSANGLYVSADNLVSPLICRTMIAGDKFTPFGMKGAKKISDLFTDSKVDNILRNRLPILSQKNNPGSAIICLPGFRIDSNYMVTSQTQEVLIVRVAR